MGGGGGGRIIVGLSLKLTMDSFFWVGGVESLLLLKLSMNSGVSFAFKLFHSQGMFATVID